MPTFPNRCQHIKVNGTQCGCPALRRNKLCYFHKRHHDERVQINLDRMKNDRLKDDRAKDARRPATIDLPVLEDANSIQISLMQIMRLIITGQIDTKTAGLLLYALQTASANLARTSFEPNPHNIVFDPRSIGETLLDEPVWADSDFDGDEEDEKDEDEEDADEDEGEDGDGEVAKEKETSAAANPPAAITAVASKTREQWKAETEAKRNAALHARRSPSPILPASVPLGDVRKQIRDQIQQAFPDLAHTVPPKAERSG